MHVNTRVLIEVAGAAVGLWATLTASAFIWMAATDPLWMATAVAGRSAWTLAIVVVGRALTGLW